MTKYDFELKKCTGISVSVSYSISQRSSAESIMNDLDKTVELTDDYIK